MGKGEASTGHMNIVGGAVGANGIGGVVTSAPSPYPEPKNIYEHAEIFMRHCGLTPTPDAVRQLSQVFLPCLKIMCERPWSPEGETWRKSGRMGILTDIRKKFERLWERGWIYGKRHDDSAYDLINYLGMYLRSGESQWGEWGSPYSGSEG
jgi:hypothetical protein